MKTLHDEYNVPTNLNFNGSNKEIANWVKENLNQFDLNEAHSCGVILLGKEILIKGDEDMKFLNIAETQVINL